MTRTIPFTPVVCIGAGLSGICLGAQLKRKYGLKFTDIHFYERNEAAGGTWWVNRYPGAACDVPACFYSFSFAPNAKWSELLPSHTELRHYIDGVVKKFQLEPLMTFRTECESASWDSERQRWTVRLKNLDTSEKFVHECTILFSAVGQLVDPKNPEIQGMDTFEGRMFHTARWQSDVDLEGKDTIVLGNGCSGSQLVPQIVSQTKTLTQFIRTPHWVLLFPNHSFGSAAQWAFTYIPFLLLLMRFLTFLYGEYFWRMFIRDAGGARLRRSTENSAKKNILRVAPEKFHNILIPDWEVACKRRVFDPKNLYLKSLNAPNFDLVKDDVVEILPHAVRTASKTYPADVIIFATGFETQEFLSALKIQGRDGEWLHDHWSKVGGPGAYHTTAVHGFPNFFMLYGPNANTGHTSVLMMTENTINFVLKLITPILKGNSAEIEVKATAEKEYVDNIQSASKERVFSTCSNWYVSEKGWNRSNYPWSQVHYWWKSVFPKWRDWEYTGQKPQIDKPSPSVSQEVDHTV